LSTSPAASRIDPLSDDQTFPVATPILRPVAYAEGVTLIALVFIGMPAKYVFGVTAFNAALGPLHGVVFLAYVAAVIWEMRKARHSAEWLIQAGLASIIPGGTFWLFGGRSAA
jgi:integral membrane protein